MLDKVLLFCFLVLGIGLFIFSLRKQPIKDWLLAFFTASFFATVLGTIVIYFNLITYLKLGNGVNAGQIYELILFPVIIIYFYQTTYRSSILNIIFQCLLYTLGLTVTEILIKKYTNLIHYIHWNWLITFATVFFFLLGVRSLLKLIGKKNK